MSLAPSLLRIGVILLIAAACARAASGYESVLPSDAVKRYAAGFANDSYGRLEIIPTRGQPFDRSLRVHTLRRPKKSYDLQLSVKTKRTLHDGELLLARFHARARGLLFPKARAEFVFERAGNGYEKSSLYPFEADSRWRLFEHVFRVQGDYKAGEAQVNFRLGFNRQTMEIGGVELLRLPEGPLPSNIRLTRLSYDGRKTSALWRIAAERRIERHRKGNVTVEVVDARGRPVPDAAVRLRMIRHAFRFGAAVSARYLQSGPATRNKRLYRSEIIRLFNAAVIDNALKWSQWNNQKHWAVETVRWLRHHGLAVRGHNLVWPGWSHLPDELRRLEKNPQELNRAIEKHISEEAGLLSGQIAEWDVVNEPYDNHDLTDLLWDWSLAEWFRWARKADPRARLFVNDTGVLNRGGEDLSHQEGYERIIRSLIQYKAPLDAIGLQAHFDRRLTAPSKLAAILDRFARFGKPLTITEFDIDVPDESLRADYLRDFMTICFSHPAVDGIFLWEFWEGIVSGNPRAALIFDKNWTLKPSGKVWERLVFTQWWTDVKGKTDRAGRLSARGFLGTYVISAEGPDGRYQEVRAQLVLGETRVVVALK
ncbi:MAG: endo-1,4-beta-xylanase [Elusimicrobia bacterium]|nr:endo-1,4-beta-xylanase [Elusimicrobiota bacterium]